MGHSGARNAAVRSAAYTPRPWTNCTGPHSTLTRVSIVTIVQFPTAWSKNPYAMSSHGEGSGPAAAPSGYSYFVRQSEDQWTTA